SCAPFEASSGSRQSKLQALWCNGTWDFLPHGPKISQTNFPFAIGLEKLCARDQGVWFQAREWFRTPLKISWILSRCI
ncbi:MAG TPA: hypothetical protein PKM72_14150, partial [Nitrospirales bacterium]|nr:hypothetical protein [Nitrospirales bacterium]